VTTRPASEKVWADDPVTGKRRDLAVEEDLAFWAWAAVEVLRMTGVRVEELLEISHHSLVQYQLPGTGELVPLLQIVPSKTDTERLLVVSPDLADVLSVIICRIRGDSGAVPLVRAYDRRECLWIGPAPLLFQRRFGADNRRICDSTIRNMLNTALAGAALAGHADGTPLHYSPHDFRRIFITDAIMSGLPPHIAQIIAGHQDLNVTMGYKAVYPDEAIQAHLAFLTRRRALRPSEEYRTPTDEEWAEFLGHFELRKVATGTCGRAFGTPCIHEHSCLTEMILVTYPDRCGLRGVPVLTDGDWQESWLAVVIGVSLGMKGVLSVLDGAVALGVLAELPELFIKSDQAEVEDVDAISEMLESEPCPDLLERCDCLVAVSVALIVWSCVSQFVERGGVADCGTGSAGQLPDRRPGQQRAQAEAPPLRCQSYRVQDEDPVADRLELLVEVRVELAVACVEEGSGDVAEFSVLTVEQGERVVGLVGIDQRDVHVADVWSAIVDVSGDVPGLGRVVSAEPPVVPVLVGERDTQRVVWRGVVILAVHAVFLVAQWRASAGYCGRMSLPLAPDARACPG
jgi:Phage integrase family